MSVLTCLGHKLATTSQDSFYGVVPLLLHIMLKRGVPKVQETSSISYELPERVKRGEGMA